MTCLGAVGGGGGGGGCGLDVREGERGATHSLGVGTNCKTTAILAMNSFWMCYVKNHNPLFSWNGPLKSAISDEFSVFHIL